MCLALLREQESISVSTKTINLPKTSKLSLKKKRKEKKKYLSTFQHFTNVRTETKSVLGAVSISKVLSSL